ncbi:MAG: HNH endonuclease [Blastocatellales bacterium]
MKLLSVKGGARPAQIDDDIYEWACQKPWRLIKVSNGAVYIGWKTHEKGKDKTIYLHREIVGSPKDKMVDHANGDIFDCQRSNLRVVTNSQNQMNSKKRPGTSSLYKNVSWNEKLQKWKAQMRVDGREFFFGYFDEERPAAHVVELNRQILHGEHARSNFTSDEIVGMFVSE